MIKIHVRFFIIGIFAVLVANGSLAITASPTPGGIVTFQLASSEVPPVVTYLDKPVAVIPNQQGWLAVLGLSLNIKPGEHQVLVNNRAQTFSIESKDYPEQHITLKTRKHIDLSAEDLARHRKEKAKAMAAYGHFDTQQIPDFAFIKPVNGPYSSPFGLKRFFNGEPRNPHSGLDIAAPTGTPIRAPAAGKVVLTGDFFFNGKVVYVDHGQGLVSMFCHLDKIDVSKGANINKGDLLGKVGATGRVTGPHLHWSVSLNNSRIDPMLLLPTAEQNAAR